jgi:peptide-methionine (S)-S-oxide reductase
MYSFSRMSALLIIVMLAGTIACNAGDNPLTAVPKPTRDAPTATSKGEQTAVIAGGCFWGIQETGHAESVKITYDPSRITYGQLLRVFLSVAHDPTQLNRQGPDSGTQYRSVIFYSSDEQKRIAEAYVVQLEKAKVFPHSIVTQVVPLKAFYPAEAYHQNYAANHPNNPYIGYNDAPKVAHLHRQFPELYDGK